MQKNIVEAIRRKWRNVKIESSVLRFNLSELVEFQSKFSIQVTTTFGCSEYTPKMLLCISYTILIKFLLKTNFIITVTLNTPRGMRLRAYKGSIQSCMDKGLQ